MKLSKFSPIARATGVMGVTAAMITGITFAAFNTNSVVLADSNLTVDTSVLRISSGGAYATAAAGFNDTLTPGITSTAHEFYLQNLSNSNLAISVGVSADAGNLDGNGIIYKIYDQAGVLVLEKTYTQLNTTPQLLDGQLNALAAGSADGLPTEGDYTYTVTVNGSAVTGNSGNLGNYDLTFTGTSL
jgi:hypothetical protein